MDQAKNFAKGTLSAALDEDDTTLTLQSGEGARFPTAPFNATIWSSTDYPDPSDDPDVEIVRVSDVTGDVLTISRGEEGTVGTPHDDINKTYTVIAGLTAKVLNEDLQLGIVSDLVSGTSSLIMDGAGWDVNRDAGTSAIGDVGDAFNGTIVKADDDNQQVTITRQVIMPNLPTSNPAIAGALWNDGGTVKMSAG